ncbi:hypothetical protein L1987_11253 [Smallanthus sonchifolius]|uniref:Uncharacterized protein n=1 Tax=Smallanthus sonchifolius TaxID=185202 RepID=A0ACB9JAS8_9ASTR|nr:hypothetical protein L1987_11253 [Smallanthus sonchifolius]
MPRESKGEEERAVLRDSYPIRGFAQEESSRRKNPTGGSISTIRPVQRYEVERLVWKLTSSSDRGVSCRGKQNE